MLKHIRQSILGSYLKCGKQFEYRHIENIVMPPGIAARRGSGTHKAAEINHKQKKSSGIDLPASDLKDVARDEFTHLLKEEGVYIPKYRRSESNSIINEGLNKALEAIEIYHSEFAPKIFPKTIEEDKKGDFGFGMPIGGIIDVVDQDDVIIDLKVMKRKDQTWADRELQPTFYTLLKNLSRFKYYIMVPNKTVVPLEIETSRNEDDVKILKAYIEQFMNDYETGSFKPADPGHWICSPDWCGYWEICPYAKKQIQ